MKKINNESNEVIKLENKTANNDATKDLKKTK